MALLARPRKIVASVVLATAVLGPVDRVQAQASSSGTTRAAEAETLADALPRVAVDGVRPRAFSALAASVSALRDSVVARAQGALGIKYLLGGNDPSRGFDCSALIKYVLSAIDISLPRTAQEQARMGRSIPKDRSQMKPGDLLTFGTGARITHIGMYMGEGRFVHASTSKRQVIESSLDQSRSSLVKQWKGVRRLVDGDRVASRYDSVFAYLDSMRDSVSDRRP